MSSNPDYTALECRFAVYTRSKNTDDDLHLIKEVAHLPDGTLQPRVRFKKNYQRPFWIVKKGLRNYKDQKEWIEKDQLDEYQCTQSELTRSILKALGKGWYKGTLRDLDELIYVFGADILSTSLIKHEYAKKWDVNTPFSVAVFDTETDMVHGEEDILMATVSFKKKVFTAVQEKFVKGYVNPAEQVKKLAQLYLGDILTQREIELEVVIVKDEISVVKETFKRMHAWKPDFMAVWNLPFDIKKVLQACEKAKVDPEEIFCDPAVPSEYRSFKFKEGPAKKITASGRVISYKPAQRWHTVFAPSSFYWVDAMSAYRAIRQGQPEEKSYSLDATLERHLGIRKLKFEAAKEYETNGPKWHQFMQENYPLEYIVYNQFDCISMEILDEKIKDLQLSMPSMAMMSDFQHFSSQPRRTVTDLHFHCLEENHVIASTSSEMSDDFDLETTSVDGWVIMLASERVTDSGLRIIEENLLLPTNIRIHNGDLDVSAAYPTNGEVMNISRKTTSKEIVNFVGVDEYDGRMQTINFSAGRTNAIEFCTVMFKLPTLDQWLDAFQEEMQGQ